MPKNYQALYSNSWALVIGINAYHNTNPLSYACNDADAVASVLINELGFPSKNVTVLKDNQATKDEIMEHYLGYRDAADNIDDRIVVFFAGHGTTMDSSRGPVGYLVPVDGDPRNLNTLIRWDDLTRNADLIPAKHILFIMDACYSGLAFNRAVPSGTHRFVSDMLQRSSRQVISAGKSDEVVADGGGLGGNNSIFTGYLIEGMKGRASDAAGVLSGTALMYYVYQQVSQDNRSNQTPEYGHIDGEGDFILKVPAGADFLTEVLPEKHEGPAVVLVNAAIQKPSYAAKANYADPSHPNFGRNELSEKLVEHRWSRKMDSQDVRALSWLSLIVEPIANELISIDIVKQQEQIQELNKPRADMRPYERYLIPNKSRTTINSLLYYDEFAHDTKLWRGYIRLDKSGSLEYVDSSSVFGELDGFRHFRYVQIIGAVWQVLYLAKSLLGFAGYEKGVRLLVNMVGTKDSILADFSTEHVEGKDAWMDPFEGQGWHRDHLFELKCPDQNLQIDYDLVIGNLNEDAVTLVAISVASQLALAYNHGSTLRCFNYDSTVFPWKQYFNKRSNWR